jgi:tRNA uridine 5-carboxymethylaminomethyl modification enzyme
VGDRRWQVFSSKVSALDKLRGSLSHVHVNPGSPLSTALEKATGEQIGKETPLLAFLKRPAVTLDPLIATLIEYGGVASEVLGVDPVIRAQLEIETKYEGYIRRQEQEIAKIRRHEGITLPDTMQYQDVPGLSRELQEKLEAIRPHSLARAARIPGMTPAALSLLLVAAKRLPVGDGMGPLKAAAGLSAD